MLALDRSATSRTSLLASFARAVSRTTGTGQPRPAGSPAELVAVAAEQIDERAGDDIDDPYARSEATYAACAGRIADLVTPVVAALARSCGG